MLQRLGLIVTSLILLLPLSGCWDVKYLDQLSIVMAIGVDEDPDNAKNIIVTLQVVVPSQASESSSGGGGGGGNVIPVTNYTGKGQTLLDAYQNMESMIPRRLYFSHNQLLVIGEGLAKRGVGGLFDLIDRDPEIRIDFGVVIAKQGTAAEILQTLTTMEKLPVKQMYEMIRSYNKRVGAAYMVKIKDFMLKLDNEKETPVAGSIEFIGDPEEAGKKKNVEQISPDSYLRLGNMAVFKQGKLAGYLNKSDSKGLAVIKNKVERLVITIPVEDGKVHIAVLHSHATMKARFNRGRPEIVIDIDQKADVFDVDSKKIKVDKKETIQWLEKEAEKQIAKQVQGTLATLQHDLHSDAAGYGKCVYRIRPRYWNSHKQDWDTLYPEVRTEIKVDVNISSTGIRNQSYLQRMK